MDARRRDHSHSSSNTRTRINSFDGTVEPDNEKKRAAVSCEQPNSSALHQSSRTSKPRTLMLTKPSKSAHKTTTTNKKAKYFKTAPSSAMSPTKKSSSSTSRPVKSTSRGDDQVSSLVVLDSSDNMTSSKFGRLKASLAFNLTEMRRLYTSWRANSHEIDLREALSRGGDVADVVGMHEWAVWRTRVNENLIDSSINNEDKKQVESSSSSSNNKIRPHVASFLTYVAIYGEKEPSSVCIDPEAFMLYGLPRVNLNLDRFQQQQQQQQTQLIQNMVPNKLTIDERVVQDKVGFESLYPYKGEKKNS